MAELNSLRDSLVDEIKDLLNAEKQLTRTLPNLAKNARNPDFRAALESHLGETHAQIARLDEVAQLLEATLAEEKAAAEDEKCDGLFRFEPDFAGPTTFEPRPATAPTASWSLFLFDFLLKPAQRRRAWLVPFYFLSRFSPRWKHR